ncbi:hypothetical protein AWZ03_015219, partial [Drosophila navojoa]
CGLCETSRRVWEAVADGVCKKDFERYTPKTGLRAAGLLPSLTRSGVAPRASGRYTPESQGAKLLNAGRLTTARRELPDPTRSVIRPSWVGAAARVAVDEVEVVARGFLGRESFEF